MIIINVRTGENLESTHIPVHLGGVVSQRTGENLDPYPGTPGGSGGQSEDW